MSDKDDSEELRRQNRLRNAIDQLDDNHLLCRDLGHRWSLQAYHSRLVETLSESNVAVVERVVRCTVCRTTRTEQVDRSTGELVRRLYAYADGYKFKPGVAGKGGMAKGPFRKAWMSRVDIEEAEDG